MCFYDDVASKFGEVSYNLEYFWLIDYEPLRVIVRKAEKSSDCYQSSSRAAVILFWHVIF